MKKNFLVTLFFLVGISFAIQAQTFQLLLDPVNPYGNGANGTF